jgi:hypothetical protein
MPIRRAAPLLLTALLALTLTSVRAQFEVRQAEPFIRDRVLHVNSRLDLSVNPKIEEALSKGIPIDIVIEVRLVRYRWWWRNVPITDPIFTRRVQFHALSRQYLVSGGGRGDSPVESFGTLAQALAYLGDLSELTVILTEKKELRDNARHLLALRAYLDVEALPVIMRPLAYVTPSWRLNTGWTEWPVKL